MSAFRELYLTRKWLRSAAWRYGFAAAVTSLAYVLQRLVWPYIPPSPHLFFYPAVFIAAHVGGAKAGYVATALATLGIAYGFLPPEGMLAFEQASDGLDLVIFFGVGMGISAALGRLRVAIQRERAAALVATIAKESTDATWSMVAHDLRTPLSVIQLGSRTLGERPSIPPDVEKTINLIRRSTDRASLLLEDALDAMRAAEGRLSVNVAPCDARELCAHAVDSVALLAARKGLRLESDVSTRCDILCDQPRLEQVLMNLLGNAIKFTPAGGLVSLYADEGAGGISFSVRDTGCGIRADDIESIFSKHWSGERGGSGLGLWIACALVEAHGSRLTVESRPGRGSVFRFTVPAAPAAIDTGRSGNASSVASVASPA